LNQFFIIAEIAVQRVFGCRQETLKKHVEERRRQRRRGT